MNIAENNGISESLNIGLFGIGLDTYWPQFEGLKTRLENYLDRIAHIIASNDGVNLVNVGLVDNPEQASSVGLYFRREAVDMIFLYISTYALSSTVLPIAQTAGVPTIVLNIQPVPAIDYEAFNAMEDRGKMTGEWLAHCQACSVPEIANVFNRAKLKYYLLTGYIGDKRTEIEIQEWITAAGTAKTMRQNRLGVMGHYYAGMLDVYTDVTRQLSVFGGHVELLEIDELVALSNLVTDNEIKVKKEEFNRIFNVSPECDLQELNRAARTSVALDRLTDKHELGSMAFYYEGMPGTEHEDVVTSVIAGNTLLTGKHIPIAGECEIKNAQAMKILDSFGIGGSFSEFYAIDFDDNIIMLGHDGPAHFAIAEGKVGLVPLPVYHGKPGKGLSIQMTVKHGPVTLLSVCEGSEGVFLLVAEGWSVPGPVLNIGNTNSRYRFSLDVREFIDAWAGAGPSHHCAIGIGHIVTALEKFAGLMDLPIQIVCRGK